MKAFLVALFVLVMGDIAINHGDATHAAMQLLGGFWRWIASAGRESIFSS